MKIDKSALFLVAMLSLVVIVVGASQYQQFSLNSSNSVKLEQINKLLQNQTNDLLRQLESHRNQTEETLHITELQTGYLKDTNKILHNMLNIVNSDMVINKNMTK